MTLCSFFKRDFLFENSSNGKEMWKYKIPDVGIGVGVVIGRVELKSLNRNFQHLFNETLDRLLLSISITLSFLIERSEFIVLTRPFVISSVSLSI